MATFNICNAISGTDFGSYEGDTEEEALDALAIEAGYRDFAEALRVSPAALDEIIVTRISY
jgi:hypothetical protein